MSRLPLRARLTTMVTVVFGVALVVLAVFGLGRMEAALRADTERNAEALLVNYFNDLTTGQFAGPSSRSDATTRFVYLDGDGQDVTQQDFDRLVGIEIAELLDDSPSALGVRDFLPPRLELPDGDVALPDVLTTIVTTSEVVAVEFELLGPTGPTRLIDRGADVIAVGAPIQLGENELMVAVSSPLRPVRDSIDRLRQLLLLAVPTLIVAIALATWLIVGRALRPVEAMTARVDRITSESLDQRVPLPAGRDELSHLATTMNAMLARLQTSRDAQRQFISDASHELRSPITATQATLEVARNDVDEVDWETTSQVLFDENQRLAGLVDDLLLSAQLDEVDLMANASEIDLDEVCITEAKRPRPCPVHVRVESPARVRGNLAHLTRAVRNVVDNASRHAATRVDVVVSSDVGWGFIEVLDDGPGIAPESLEMIFERFTRLDQARHRDRSGQPGGSGGAGLGLAITRQICEAHDGTIVAANRIALPGEGSGARFTIRLPIDDED